MATSALDGNKHAEEEGKLADTDEDQTWEEETNGEGLGDTEVDGDDDSKRLEDAGKVSQVSELNTRLRSIPAIPTY